MAKLNAQPSPRPTPRTILQASILGALLYAVMVTLIYQTQPFGSFISDKVVDIAVLFAAAAAAYVSYQFRRQFQPDEAPHHVWNMFTLGLLFWVAGEVSGMVYDFIYWNAETYPDLMITDLCWLAGYTLLGLALYYQYRIVFGRNSERGTHYYLFLILLALGINTLLTNAAIRSGLGEGSSWLVVFITILYPVFDATTGIGALYLSYLFKRGHWIRPWWGLILFALSDSINIFYWLGGYKLIPSAWRTPLDLTGIFLYTNSYLVMAISFLSLYFMFRFGINSGLIIAKKDP
ncbi:MAG: hypothetical protein HXY38_12200 [Chloroflexi bacterium]|nr:hypothetical protein [Chloroflexota bacterium]